VDRIEALRCAAWASCRAREQTFRARCGPTKPFSGGMKPYRARHEDGRKQTSGSIAVRTNNGVRSCQHSLPSSTGSFARHVWRRCASNTSRRSANGVVGSQIPAKQRGFQMRKTILIAAFAILSTTAYAGPSRGLSLATNEDPTTTLPSTQSADVAAPTPAGAAQPTPAPTPVAAPAQANQPTERAKPRKTQMTPEARVIYELHRHGIYW
jgi:hypothetical protein